MCAAPACAGAKKFKPFNEIINIGFKVEPATGQRHITRVFPVGDVDVMRDHHALDCAAQERRKMPGHGRTDEKPWLFAAAFVGETLQLPEWLTRKIFFLNRQNFAVDDNFIQSERWLSTRQNRMGKNFQCRSSYGCHSAVIERRRQRAEPFRLFLRNPACTSKPAALKVISGVKHIEAFKISIGNILPQLHVALRVYCALHHRKSIYILRGGLLRVRRTARRAR